MKPNFWYSVCLCSLVLTSIAPAGAVVVVELPRAGEYTVWLTNGPDGSVVAGPMIISEAAKTTLDTGKAKNEGKWILHAVDVPKGNAARAEIAAGEAPRITLKSESFHRIARVNVTVTDKEGKKPSWAYVVLTDGKGNEHGKVIGPDEEGVALFQEVASGDGKIRVQQGDPSNQQTITVPLRLDREEPVLAITADVSLPETMKVLAADTERHRSDPSDESPQVVRPGNPWGIVLGFALLAAVLYAAWRAMRSRGLTPEKVLNQMGVQLPEDAPTVSDMAVPEPQVDPNQCPFCGQQKDPVTGTCACTLNATPSVPRASAAPSTVGARLVAISGAHAGQIYPINGTLTIGRDSAQNIALSEDSVVSRRHATITTDGGGVNLVDNGSSNGTFVNGRKIDHHTLQSGDEILVGSTRFRYEE